MTHSNPLPTAADLFAAYQSGPAGAALANRLLDAATATAIATGTTTLGQRANVRPEAPPAHHYGWRFWALSPDGALMSPNMGAQVSSSTFFAPCRKCGGAVPALECRCGVHYLADFDDLFTGTPCCWVLRPGYKPLPNEFALASRVPVLHAMIKRRLACVVTFGVAIGDVADDTTAERKVLRARRWHILAMLLGPPAGPLISRRRSVSRLLSEHYGCEVRQGISRKACEQVQQRLAASVTANRLAELASAPAAPLICA